MKHGKQKLTVKVTEFTAFIHSVVKDPQIGNSSDLYKQLATNVRSLSPEDYDKVNKAYQRQYKQDLKAIFGSFGIGSTESIPII